MAPHIRKTVAEIDDDIQKLQGDILSLRTTRATLVNLYGGDEEIPAVPAGLKLCRKCNWHHAQNDSCVPSAKPPAKRKVGTLVMDGKTHVAKLSRDALAPSSGAGASPPPTPAGEGKRGRAPSAATVKLTAAMRTAPEPFTVASLLVATGGGMDKQDVGRVLNRYAGQGLLVHVKRGEYQRTGKFPAETPAETPE